MVLTLDHQIQNKLIIRELFSDHNLYKIKGLYALLQVGLGLSYAAPIVSSLSNFLTSFTETEKEMVSVERVLQVK